MLEFDHTGTNPPIAYESYNEVTGARYVLYPVTGKHTEEHVKKACGWLYYNKDVISVQSRWRMRDGELAPPEKIPDLVIIKELKVEVGKLKSYIEELEHKQTQDLVKEREAAQKENSKVRQATVKEELYLRIKKENTQQKKEILKLKGDISNLMYQINKANNLITS